MSELPKFVTGRMRHMKPVGEHPDADVLSAFSEQLLSERERTYVLMHLATCAECRDVMATAMQREPVELLELSAAEDHEFVSFSSPAPAPERPERLELSAVADEAYEQEVVPRSWFRWPAFHTPRMRWVAAAACAVIVSAAVLLNTRNAKNEAMRASSDAIVLKSEQQATSQAPPSNALGDELASEKESRLKLQQEISQAVATPASKLAAKRKQDLPSAQPESDKKAPAAAGRANSLAYDSFARQREYATPVLRERVEDLALTPGVAKKSSVTTQEKNAASISGSAVNGRDQTGVRVADKIATQAAAAAPASAAAERTPSASLASPPASRERDDDANRAVGASSETVEVSSGPVAVVPIPLEEKQLESLNRASAPRWNVTADGDVLRSLDAGKNWKTIAIDSKAQFVAVATTGASIWAGGKGGVLYHSADVGEHWTRVTPHDGNNSLTSDISGIEFSDIDHGTIRAGKNERWITSDGGKSWKSEWRSRE